MKAEGEWDHTKYHLSVIYSPQHKSKYDPPGTFFWLAHVRLIPDVPYYGAHGKGPTLQAAIDDAIGQLDKHVARHAQGAYSKKASAEDLDLSGLFDD